MSNGYKEEEKNISVNANSSANAGNNSKDENGMAKVNSMKSNETITESGVDDLQSDNNGAAGTDRAGTAERKLYGDIELNKGLEAQAKDEEGSKK